MSPDAPVAPPLLSGHGLDKPDEIVLGAGTLAALHKHVGDTVIVSSARNSKSTTLQIVGTATMPTIGANSNHPTMGTGALLDEQLIPPSTRNQQQSAIPGPRAVLLRINNSAAPTAALGFTRRQLAAVVAWQSTIAVALGVIIGIPLGIVAGRTLWDLFARQIHAVPAPTTPTLPIGLIAIGALVLANLVAAIPGYLATRTRTAVLLHAE